MFDDLWFIRGRGKKNTGQEEKIGSLGGGEGAAGKTGTGNEGLREEVVQA